MGLLLPLATQESICFLTALTAENATKVLQFCQFDMTNNIFV